MKSIRLLLPLYVLLLAVMFILPIFSMDGYSVIAHTTSQLGAQNTPHAWVMNITFMLLGIASILEGWHLLGAYYVQKSLLFLFGSGLIMTAIFQHAPIVDGMPYNMVEDQLHSIFASVVGFSFVLFAFSAAFIEPDLKRRWLALAVGMIASGLSLLMSMLGDYSGVWQRLIFMLSFAWLIFFFEDRRQLSAGSVEQ